MTAAELEAVAAYINAQIKLGITQAMLVVVPPAIDEEALIDRVLARIPVPKDGENGKDADPVDVQALVATIVAQIPAAKDGKDGEPGKDAAPVDLVALAERVRGLIPTPRDGRDGVATRDEIAALIKAEVAEVTGATVPTAVADAIAALPIPTYKGVWNADANYKHGDTASFGGSVWHCNITGTKAKPEDDGRAWSLMVKRGRDARDVVARG